MTSYNYDNQRSSTQRVDVDKNKNNRENVLNILTKEVIDEFVNSIKYLGVFNFGEEFIRFLKSKKPELFERLKESVGKIDGLTWTDIKDFYLESGTNLEILLTKEIFKSLKFKEATKGIVKVFTDKIEKILAADSKYQQLYQQTIYEIRDKIESYKLETQQDVEEFLNEVGNKIKQLLNNISDFKLKNKIRKLKVTNKEIIKALEELGKINKVEAIAIGGSEMGSVIKNTSEIIKEKLISDITPQRLEELNDFLEKLLFANIVDYIYNSKEKLDITIAYLRNCFKIPTLKEVVNFNSDDFLNWIRNSSFLVEIRQIEPCALYLDGDSSKMQECYKRLIEDNFDLLKKVFVEYIKNNVDKKLGDILEKLFINKQAISVQQKQYLAEKFYGNNFKTRLLDTIVVSYNLSEDEKNNLNEILHQLFDFSNNVLSFKAYDGSSLEIKINKDLIFCKGDCNIRDINDLLSLYPVYDFEFVNLEKSQFLKIFKNDLINIRNLQISPYQKVRVRDVNGEQIEGYLNIAIDEKRNQLVEILKNPIYEIEKEEEVIKILSLKDIDEVVPLEPLKYKFNTKQEAFKKFILTFPKLVSEKVNDLLEDEYIKKKIDEILSFPKKDFKKNSEDFKGKQKDSKEFLKNVVRELNYELRKINGEEFEIKKIEDLKNYCFMVESEYIGVKGYESEFVKLEMKDIVDDKIVINFQGGIKEIPDDKKQVEIDIGYLPEFFKRLNIKFTLFKYSKLQDYKQFEEWYNNVSDIMLDSKYKVNWGKRKNSTKIENKKFYKKLDDDWKEVKYFVKEYKFSDEKGGLKDGIAIYSVVLGDKGYELKVCQEIDVKKGICLKWRKVKTDMSYNHLIMWLTNETEFYPMTDEELRIKVYDFYKKDNNIGKLGWSLLSLSTILFSVKNVVNAVKSHFKEDEEIKAALVYQKLIDILPGGSLRVLKIFEELKDEAGAELDSRIWGYINKFKNRLIRTDEGKGGAHGSKAAEVIKREIFEKVEQGKELKWKERLKAAGYLLYAVEKGPGPYFRGLGGYNKQGLWIKALLGKQAYQQWIEQNSNLITKLNLDPNNTALKDELVNSELRFIYSHEKVGELYSKNFSPTLEGLTINLYSVAEAEQAYKIVAPKGNFYDIEIAFVSYVNQFRIPHAVGSFKALAERVEDENHYIHIYKNLLWMGLSGFIFSEFKGENREYFTKICRTYGYQIGTLFHSAKNLQNLLRFMDLVVKRKGIKLEGGYKTFTEYIFGKESLTPNKVNYYDLEVVNQSYLKSIREKLEILRSYAGKDIVSVLDISDKLIFDIYEDENLTENEKEAIAIYLNSLNETLDDDWVVDIHKIFVTKEAPYWIDGSFNLGRKLFNELIKIEERRFVDKAKAEGIIKAILNKLYNIEDGIDNSFIYEFLIKKFNTRFGGYYENASGGKFLKEMLINRIEELNETEFVEKFAKSLCKKFGYGGKIPDSLKDLLNVFSILIYRGAKSYIKRNKNGYLKLVNNVFKKQLEEVDKWGKVV